LGRVSLSGSGWQLPSGRTVSDQHAIGQFSADQQAGRSLRFDASQTPQELQAMQAIWFFLILGVLSYLFMMREKYAPKAKEAVRDTLPPK
jgi:hypothetical protein